MKISQGKVSSLSLSALDLSRRAFEIGAEPEPEFGFRPFPKQGGVVANELIDRLREETGD